MYKRQARENERVLMFSPSFTLFVSDLYSTRTRIFSLLFRMGKFPRPPPITSPLMEPPLT